MIKFAKKVIDVIISNDDKKILLENIFSLSILQAVNYILPLITLPYLVRILGPSKYGLVAFSQSFIAYFNIITNYGFNLSATKEISINRNNLEKVSKIFSSVILVKFILFLISFIILTIILLSFGRFENNILLYYYAFGIVLGQVLFPIWLYQGMEKMKYITILNIVAKSIFTIAIFIFIKSPFDYLYVPLINSLGYISAGVLSFFIVFKQLKIKFYLPNRDEISFQLREGWYFFISSVAKNLYTASNTFILGLFTNDTIVGYYSAAEKIIKAIQGLIQPISGAVYPHISNLVQNSKVKAIRFIKKLAIIIGIGTFTLSVLIFFFSGTIVSLVLGKNFSNSIIVLRILSFLPFIIGLSNILGIQTMVTFGYKKQFSNILVIASILNITLDFVLVPFYKHIGISIAVLISEMLVTTTMFVFLQLKKVKVFGGTVV